MSKPREFWIIYNPYGGSRITKTEPKLGTAGTFTHVIEYSAYQALAQAAKDFMSALTDEEKIQATDKLAKLIDEVEM